MCVFKFSPKTRETFMWNHNRRRGKLILMIQVICCSSLFSVPGRAGAFSRDFTTSFALECRAFSGALKIEKLKALLIPGPEGAVDTNDWCTSRTFTCICLSCIIIYVYLDCSNSTRDITLLCTHKFVFLFALCTSHL